MGELAVNVSIGFIKVGVFLYDVITYPIYAIIDQPWRVHNYNKVPKAELVGVSEGLCYRSVLPVSPLQVELTRKNVDTLDKLMEFSFSIHGNKKALGTRKILSEFNEPQPNGKIFKKYEMGDYSWLTFSEVKEVVKSFGRGLREIGHEPKENIVILSETRSEWLLSALGCFKQSIPICTIYATLGEEALIHGVNETEVRHIIVSHDLMPKLKIILKHCPKIEKVIYFTDQLNQTDTSWNNNITFHSFQDIVEKGEKSNIKDFAPTAKDTAVIMYTSGSTGAPKGVVISHFNLINSIHAYAGVLKPMPTDIFLAFLPLAHVLELIGESMMLLFGVPLGYSSPLTMTDRSTKIKRGCKGDVSILHPTLMPSVPLILDRIYKGILEKVAAQGPFLQALFNYGVKYRMNWSSRGWGTPICNWFVFRKIRALLGGKIRVIAAGGAPLSPETHNFIRAALGAPVIQGYGLTETCGCATLMDINDNFTAKVGTPTNVNDVKLVDWEEGNYRITDKPYPRGEIIIGGNNIAVGYFKNPEKTQEDFFEMDGRRWFRTGDVGEFEPDGVLKIIDRKKDLVKLQFGEYVSLGKVESELKVCPLVENICVYGDSTKNNIVAIVSPDIKHLRTIASGLNKGEDESVESLSQDNDIIQHYLNELVSTGKKAKLEKFEMPTAVHLTPELWTPDTGLVTAAFKLKRKQIQSKYQTAINRMYGA